MKKPREIKKGFYSKEEVDGYINETVNEYEMRLSEQKERIFSQVEDVDKLKVELSTYKKRENYIAKAILSALEKADQIEQSARLKYDAEIEKLQLFYNKFLDYYNNMLTVYPTDDEIIKIGQFLKQMDNVMKTRSRPSGKKTPDAIEQTKLSYEQERQRLTKNGWQIKPIEEQINNINIISKNERLFKKYTADADEAVALLSGINKNTPVSKMKKYLDSRLALREPVNAAVDLDEVLYPTQSLEDLCKELGLLTEE
jgi:cell division septum initiation protein DivIVA